MAKPMRMPTRRFLFVEPRRKGSFAPVYIALLSVLAVGLLGLLAVAWVPSEPSAQRPVDGSRAGGTRSFEGSFLPPPAPTKPPHSGTWM
jgi:hypothetical protein